jgi:hypothetical protein
MSQTKSQLIEGSAASELTAAKTLLGAGSAGAPSLTATGDTNTGIFFPTADTLAASTAGSERLRINSDGRLLVGTSTSSGIDALLQVVKNSGENAQFHRGVNSTSAPQLVLSKSRNATYGSYTIVQEDDVLGIISFRGDDGTDYLSPGAQIRGEVDGTPGADDMPGRIVLATTADGDSSPTERMRIDSSGRLLVGTSSDRSSAGVNGRFQLEGTSYNTSSVNLINNGNDIQPSYLVFGKSRSGSVGGTTVVQSGDYLGKIDFAGADGSDLNSVGASIDCQVDATPGANDMPGRLVFSTTADGASTPTERMRLDSAGDFLCVGIYNNTTASAANVRVASSGKLDRSTSSAKYKTSIETLEDSYADAILACRPVWYRSICKNDNPDYGWWGFIAEEVATIDPRLVHWKTVEVTYDEKGSAVQTPCDPEPEGVAYDRFVPHLLNLIKRQGEAIADLQAEVAALKAQ